MIQAVRNYTYREGETHGKAACHGRALENYRTIVTAAEATAQGGTASCTEPQCPDRHPLRPQDGHRMGRPAKRNGLWKRHDLLAMFAGLAQGGRMGQTAPRPSCEAASGGQDRLVPRRGGQRLGACCFWGAKTGPNPTDRRKNGSKHHAITDAQGVPFAVQLTGANRHDSTRLLGLVDAIPSVSGKRGRPRRRPDSLQGDRGYDCEGHRKVLRRRGITPVLARRRTEHGSGLGVTRWVVERTLSWLHQFRRLRIRYERRADIHEAFMMAACSIICFRTLHNGFC